MQRQHTAIYERNMSSQGVVSLLMSLSFSECMILELLGLGVCLIWNFLTSGYGIEAMYVVRGFCRSV